MIEVEKGFQVTEEELGNLLKDAEFSGDKTNHDIYYDFPDYHFFNNGIKLRNRNGSFELKIKLPNGSSNEIEDEEEVKKYLNTELPIQGFVDENMVVFSDYINKRKKYKKDEFIIDVEGLDFVEKVLKGKVIEIELMVNNENEVSLAIEKILNFAKEHGIMHKKIPAKREIYLMVYNPDLYKKLYLKE